MTLLEVSEVTYLYFCVLYIVLKSTVPLFWAPVSPTVSLYIHFYHIYHMPLTTGPSMIKFCSVLFCSASWTIRSQLWYVVCASNNDRSIGLVLVRIQKYVTENTARLSVIFPKFYRREATRALSAVQRVCMSLSLPPPPPPHTHTPWGHRWRPWASWKEGRKYFI